MRRETLPESQEAETADSAVPTRAGAPLAAAGSPGRCAVAGLGLGREAPQQARRPSECPVCRGMRTGGGGHAVQSPWGGGRDPRCPQGHRIATCTSRSTGAGQAGRPRSPAGRAAHVSGAPGQPARPPARPPAPYRTPRPRRAAAASLRAALRSVSALRGLGPPSSSAAASAAAAALSAGPPRAAAGARPGAPRASASSRHAAPSGAGAPAEGRGLGSAPQARSALPSRGRLDHRAAAARCRAPRPHASGRPRPAGPRPLGLRLQRSASSAPATRAAGEEARRRGREHARARRAQGARARRAQGARARPPRAPRGLACCCPGERVHCGGRGWGPQRGGSGEPSCCPGPCTSDVLSVPASCEGAKIPEPQQEKRTRQRLLSSPC